MVALQGAPFDESLAVAVIRRVLERRMGMFSAFYDIGYEDLENECLVACLQAWPRFNAAATYSENHVASYFYSVAARHLLYRARGLNRRLKTETAARNECRTERPDASARHEISEDIASLPLVDQLGAIYRAAKRASQDRPRRKPRRGPEPIYSHAQILAIRWLQAHRRMSIRGTIQLLEVCPPLRVALELQAIPHFGHFLRRKKSVAHFRIAREFRPAVPKNPAKKVLRISRR